MRACARVVIVLAPDSFKGSLGAPAVCAAMAVGVRRVFFDDVEVRSCPMADGGEGTLDAVLSRGGERHSSSVRGAGGGSRRAHYGVLATADGPATVIEIAEIVGITDAAGMAVSVLDRSTSGIGELLRARLDAGARRFMVGLGGSSTNDGGAGMLAALGVRFRDAAGDTVQPTPAGLRRLKSIDATGLDPRLTECSFTILSDVTNPLCGDAGATAIFGPQKGVPVDEVHALDLVIERYASLAEGALGVQSSIARRPGSGAAGGLGFAVQLLGGVLRSGADVVADLIGLDEALCGAEWAITGEGKSDAQTLAGKAPLIVARRARAAGVPVTLLSGAVDSAALPELGQDFAGCFALPAGPTTLAASLADAGGLVSERTEQLARLWRASR